MKQLALLIIYALFASSSLLAENLSAIFVDRYEKSIGRITINSDSWNNERDSDWHAALEDVKLTSGLILDLRGMTGSAEPEIPKLLGYFLDESAMSVEDAAGYRQFLNGAPSFMNPLLLQYSEHVPLEIAQAIELLTQSRTYTEITTCDLDCKMSRQPLRRFKRHVHTIELEQQERMDRMFNGTPDIQPLPTTMTPQAEPTNK